MEGNKEVYLAFEQIARVESYLARNILHQARRHHGQWISQDGGPVGGRWQ